VKESIKYHLLEAVQAAAAEAEGKEELSLRLHAATRLRLINMPDDDLWDLSVLFAVPLGKTVPEVFHSFKLAVAEHKKAMKEWRLTNNNYG
jgi:hypothetical protein